MSELRFSVGATVMCNLGPDGWQLGKIIALHYREPHWAADRQAPYQVLLEASHELIYVPMDDVHLCRKPTFEEVQIMRRTDALAELPDGSCESASTPQLRSEDPPITHTLSCGKRYEQPRDAYRSGHCQCCNPCPKHWSYVELYSEHYRCAHRNRLTVTHHSVDLGTVSVGASIKRRVTEGISTNKGYAQCPTLVRLPPGLDFSDEGVLSGKVEFDPHRPDSYSVQFVAVSSADWTDTAVGLVRLEVTCVVDGNAPPKTFDSQTFRRLQEDARTECLRIQEKLYQIWSQWERRLLSNRETCVQMLTELKLLRACLETHPRLDHGKWWAQLGGFYMNVHKLLENTLFECELYLGYALTFGDRAVRRQAEQNLEGCYQKRLLETARYLWIEGISQMMKGQWQASIETFQRAAAQKDGWGWAVNFGDIWLSEAVARIVSSVEESRHRNGAEDSKLQWYAEVERLLELAKERANEADCFGVDGHPWYAEIQRAINAYHTLAGHGKSVDDWLAKFKARTVYWCAQILGGADPFPPKPRDRIESSAALVQNLHNTSRRMV